ncbi:MAG: hypothetical protein ACM3KR_03460 [Deltaproteobacteria bacterium]
MKRLTIIISIILLMLSACALKISGSERSVVSQQFMTNEQIKTVIAQKTKIPKDKITDKYIWLQYVDIDEDPELELLLSYRFGLHEGYFFIFDYQNGEYVNVFFRPWSVEKMSQKEVIYASGNETVHTLTANILQMQKGKVNIIWSGIYDKYDYSKLTNGMETHGRYYIDTNGVLNYFYKVDKTNQNGIPVETDYISERYIWDPGKNMFVKK